MYRYLVAMLMTFLLISCGDGNVKPEVEEIVVEEVQFQNDGDAIKVTLDDILFDFNKTTLKPRGMNVLNKVIQIMKENPRYIVRVTGHSDNIGPKRAKQKISDGRARSVANYLIKHGIQRSRVSSKGLSDKEPVFPNTSKQNRSKNRRVEMRLSLA